MIEIPVSHCTDAYRKLAEVKIVGVTMLSVIASKLSPVLVMGFRGFWPPGC